METAWALSLTTMFPTNIAIVGMRKVRLECIVDVLTYYMKPHVIRSFSFQTRKPQQTLTSRSKRVLQEKYGIVNGELLGLALETTTPQIAKTRL